MSDITGKIGSYTVTLTPPIGRGQFGTVHKAIQDGTQTIMAAKQIIIGEQGRINTELRRMAESEIKIMEDLQSHPNIVKVQEHFIQDNVCWLFVEFCDLGNLSSYLRDNQSLELFEKIKIMHQSSSAVAFMHNQNPPIIHRDIKLDNIMMKRERGEDVVKLTDFGLSKLLPGRPQSLTNVMQRGANMMTTTCGSPYFMAPEFSAEMEGGTKYDSSVDVFSLGLVHLVVLESDGMLRDLIPLSGGTKYDSSVDVFSLGLVHLVVLESDGMLRDLIPLSVSARKAKKDVSIGYEMVNCFRNKRPLPKVINRNDIEGASERRIARIVDHMTKFASGERKNINEVEAEYQEMIEQLEQEREQKRHVSSLQREVERLTTGQRDYAREPSSTSTDPHSFDTISAKNMAVDTAEEYVELIANEWGSAMGELEDLDVGETMSRHGLLNDNLMMAEEKASESYIRAMGIVEAPLGTQTSSKLKTSKTEVSTATLKALRGHWRSTVAEADYSTLEKEIGRALRQTELFTIAQSKPGIKRFLHKSAVIAWKMVLQRPKMYFKGISAGSHFDKMTCEAVFGSKTPAKYPVIYTVAPALYQGEQLMVKAKVMCG